MLELPGAFNTEKEKTTNDLFLFDFTAAENFSRIYARDI